MVKWWWCGGVIVGCDKDSRVSCSCDKFLLGVAVVFNFYWVFTVVTNSYWM